MKEKFNTNFFDFLLLLFSVYFSIATDQEKIVLTFLLFFSIAFPQTNTADLKHEDPSQSLASNKQRQTSAYGKKNLETPEFQ